MRRFICFLFILMLIVISMEAQKPDQVLAGTYSGRYVFDKGQGPYEVDGYVKFDNCDILITPGTVFKLNPGSFLYFRGGKLRIISYENNRVLFTSNVESSSPEELNKVQFYIQNLELNNIDVINIDRFTLVFCENASITNCRFQNVERGLELWSCSGYVASNNIYFTEDYIYKSRNPGSWVYGISVTSEVGKVIVTNNRISNLISANSFPHHGGGWGISCSDNHNLEISHNKISDIGFSGILISYIDFERLGEGTIDIHHNSINNVISGLNIWDNQDYDDYSDSANVHIKNNRLSTDNDWKFLWSTGHGWSEGIRITQVNAEIYENEFDYIEREGVGTTAFEIHGDSNSSIHNNKIISAECAFLVDFYPEWGNNSDLSPAKFIIQHNAIDFCKTGVVIFYDRNSNIYLESSDRMFTENNFFSFEVPIYSELIPDVHLEDYSNNYWGGLNAAALADLMDINTLATILFEPVLSPFNF